LHTNIGDARNLKLGGKGQSTGGAIIFFSVSAKCGHYSVVVCARKRCSGVQGQSPWSGGQGASPPEAEALLVFEGSIKAANLTLFNI